MSSTFARCSLLRFSCGVLIEAKLPGGLQCAMQNIFIRGLSTMCVIPILSHPPAIGIQKLGSRRSASDTRISSTHVRAFFGPGQAECNASEV